MRERSGQKESETEEEERGREHVGWGATGTATPPPAAVPGGHAGCSSLCPGSFSVLRARRKKTGPYLRRKEQKPVSDVERLIIL